jgi:TonB family protein
MSSGGGSVLLSITSALLLSSIACASWGLVGAERGSDNPLTPSVAKLLTIEADEIDLRAAGGCVARGAAVASVGGESVRLEGDLIIFDERARIIEAVGHARFSGTGKNSASKDNLKFPIDEPGNLIALPTVKATGFSYVKRRISYDGSAALKPPVEGRLYFQRRTLYNCLKGASNAGIGIGSYLQAYTDIERQVAGEVPEPELITKIDKVREPISEQLGNLGLLVDQEYGYGILTKMCRLVESQLRSGWRAAPGFDEQVYVFCIVNAAGVVVQAETDDPVRYGETVSALAIERVKAFDLKTVAPGRSVPLVIALSNKEDSVLCYVRYISFDVYLPYVSRHFRQSWASQIITTGLRGTVVTVIDLHRDGTLSRVELSKSSGNKELDQLALRAIKSASKPIGFPDGSHEELNLELTLVAK